ncbi:MAG: hypothetical protein AAF456_01910 [Planctomycetota bacterium]
MLKTYQPSGRVGPTALPCFGIALGLVVAAAWPYQYLLRVLPLLYLNFVLTIGMAFVMAFLASLFIFLGHVRNPGVAIVFSLALAFSGIGAKFWFQYETMVAAKVDAELSEKNLFEADRARVKKSVRKELTFWKHIQLRYKEGWNDGAGQKMRGIFLIGAWLLEAAFLIYITNSAGAGTASDPYNENLNKWADKKETLLELPIDDEKLIAQIKSAVTVEQLLTMPVPRSDETNQIAHYILNRIEDHPLEDCYLSIELVTTKRNRRGEPEVETESLVNFAVISSLQLDQLAENTSLMAEALDEYRLAVKMEGVADVNKNPDSPEAKKPR